MISILDRNEIAPCYESGTEARRYAWSFVASAAALSSLLAACGPPSFESSGTYAHQRLVEYRGDTMPNQGKSLYLVDLYDTKRSLWALPSVAVNQLAPPGGAFHRVAWSPNIKRLLFATHEAVFLLSANGDTQQLNLHMLGHLEACEGMSTYAISVDGQYVAYYLYTRDAADIQADGFGRLYQDIVIQHTEGSTPMTVSRGVMPSALAWNPSNDRLAISTFNSSGTITVVDLSGRTIWTTQVREDTDPVGRGGGYISDLQWQPTGERLAMLYGDQVYLINGDGSALQKIRIGDTHNAITSIAWSPDGAHLALRMATSQSCHFALNENTFQECHSRSSLFVSDADGGHLQRIPGTEFEGPPRPITNLFWIN